MKFLDVKLTHKKKMRDRRKYSKFNQDHKSNNKSKFEQQYNDFKPTQQQQQRQHPTQQRQKQQQPTQKQQQQSDRMKSHVSKTLLEVPRASTAEEKQCGTIGRQIRLQTNHFPMEINIPNGGTIFHYHVDFTLPRGAEVKKSHRNLLVRVIERVKSEYIQLLGNPFSIVFDGQKNIYSNRKILPPEKDPFSCKVAVQDESQRTVNVGLQIKEVGQGLNVGEQITKYLGEGGKGGASTINESLQVLNIILGMTPLLHYECAGRTYFNPQEEETGKKKDGSVIDMGNGKSIWVGTFQSVRMGWRPYLNVDVANRQAYNQQPLLDFLLAVLDQGNRLDNLRQLRPRDKYRLNDELRQLKIRYSRPDGALRDYKVNKLVDSAARLSIKLEDGKEITIKDYFKLQYNYEIKHPFLPCVHVGKLNGTNFLPIELVEIKKQLAPSTKSLSEAESTKMKQETALKPDLRKKRIEKNLKDLSNAFQTDPYAREFGLTINENMEQIDGRVLPPPSMKYKNDNGGNVEVVHQGGKWPMSIGDQFLETKSIERWGVLDLAGLPKHQLYTFVDKIIKESGDRGFQISNNPIFRYGDYFADLHQVESIFWNLSKEIENNYQKKAQIIMIIAPAKAGNVYPCIKFIGDSTLGIPTQFVLKKNVIGKPKQGPSPSTIHNLCLKINAKTGGTNHGLYIRPDIMKEPTMILGADVTHSAPSHIKKPSIAAMVGSCNPEASDYLCEVRVQRQGKVEEQIERTEEMVFSLLQRFIERTRYKPVRIIYYRDGVSEGQFVSVLNHELVSIRKACERLQRGYQPKITFMVAQKRHNTSLFPRDRKDAFGKAGNIPPGTVVDTKITHPTETDFFLASHEGLQVCFSSCFTLLVKNVEQKKGLAEVFSLDKICSEFSFRRHILTH